MRSPARNSVQAEHEPGPAGTAIASSRVSLEGVAMHRGQYASLKSGGEGHARRNRRLQGGWPHLTATLEELVVDGDGRHECALPSALGLAQGEQSCNS